MWLFFFFFFSSRRRHTRCYRDWSSDVCSSDLVGTRVCDVGAGTGNLTLPLAAAGLAVVALEPNAAMRALGRQRTAGVARVRWLAACAEATPLGDATCDLVTFGS